ncbi:DNA-binding protein rif1, partial [Coemansia biformis]
MSTRPAPVKSAKSAKPTKPASEARPLTPVRATKAQEQPPVTTPKGRPLPSAVSSSLRRVHFSPCNEEIPLGVLPQSSPTRAQMRPQSRGILKRRSGGAQTDQQPSSDIDQSGGNGLLDRLLSSPPRAAANGALAPTGDTLQLAHETPNNVLPFDEAFAQAIDGLQLVGSEGRLEDAVAPSHLYNGLCGLLAKYPVQAGAAQDKAMALLDCIQRDVADPESTKQTVLAAVKCLGCALHSESICAGAAVADKLHGPLEVIAELVQHQPVPDKAVCQAAVWCIGMLRASAPAIQGVVPGLLQLCTSVMAQFSTSTTAQFECLSAIEALLRRAPGATRQAFRLWLLPVLGLVATPIAGVRTKACSMIRQNIPWVAADVHGPDMDGPMQDFIATRLSHIITSAARLLGRGDHVLVARIWGMVTVVCARYCRVRLSELLRVIQECFNSTSEDVLVATLMQWRCMIYFLVLENRLHLHRYVQLVLTPIFTILEIPKVGAEVRLACVRCWATLVYALGEDIGTHIEMVSRVAGLVAGDPSLEVREVAARVLAALFNKFVLPEDKTAQFIIPRMIIGTTMLAAGDGKSLSDTHGPFSSEVSYSGDHTAVLCNYVTGLGASSPTVPVVADTAVKFVQ